MTNLEIEKLLDLIDKCVQSEGTFKEKAQAILEQANQEQQTALLEFCSWFIE